MTAKLGLLLIYGLRFPPAGIPYLVPINKRGNLTLVREAAAHANSLFPHPNKRAKYADTEATSEFHKESEPAEITLARSRVWRDQGHRYRWNETSRRFEPFKETPCTS